MHTSSTDIQLYFKHRYSQAQIFILSLQVLAAPYASYVNLGFEMSIQDFVHTQHTPQLYCAVQRSQ